MPKWTDTMLFAKEVTHGQPSYAIRIRQPGYMYLYDDLPYSPDTWREQVGKLKSFSFHGILGSFTARAEERKGRPYWYAYRRINGKVHKRYIGNTDQLALEWLEQIADDLQKVG